MIDRSDDDDDILREGETRYAICTTAETNNFNETRSDLKFLKGDHWPEDAKRIRTAERRPCLTINKHPSFLRQITNDQRQNRPGIHVHPVSDDADPKVAEIIEGMVRHIEYDSDAATCYDTAIQSATAGGFGYFRFVTDYEGEDSFDQVIKFDRLRNVFAVHIDPTIKTPDASDMRYCFIESTAPRSDIIRDYPESKIATDGSAQSGDDDKELLLLEYYKIDETPDELLLLTNGETGYKSDLIEMPEGVTVQRRRKSCKRRVMWYKLAGSDDKVPGKKHPIRHEPRLTDVLEATELPFDYIPVFLVIGNELDIDGEVTYSGIIRDSKDSAMMYDFWMTSATEEVSLRPKTPYIGAEGQFSGHEEEWRQANTRTFSYLEYKPKAVGGVLAPPPSRQPMADVPTGVLAMAMHSSDEIKQTVGLFDASLGARSNETSGKAINARKRQGDVSNFHYADNLNRTLKHAGRTLISGIRRVYSGPRIVRIVSNDEKPGFVAINQAVPQVKTAEDDTLEVVQKIINDVTVGKYDVIVKAGPSYASLREESLDAMIEVGQSWPKLMDIAGDEVVRAMDWPESDKIADRIKKTLPPELTADDDEEGAQAPLPPETQKLIAQATQHIEQLQMALQETTQKLQEAENTSNTELQKELIKAQSAENIARINTENKFDVEELKGWLAMQLQMLQPPPVLAADVRQDMAQNDIAPQAAGQPVDYAQPPFSG